MPNPTDKKRQKTSRALAGAISAFTPESDPPVSGGTSSPVSPQSATRASQTGPISSDHMMPLQLFSPGPQGRFAKAKAAVSDVLNTVRQKITPQSDAPKTSQFKAWALTAFASDSAPLPEARQAFLSWLMLCSPAELQSLTEQVTQHCAAQKLTLEWLFETPQAIHPLLQQAAEQSVMLYCLAIHAALKSQTELELMRLFQQWQTNPDREPTAIVFQQLFAELVQQQLLPSPPADLLLTSEKRRNTWLVETLSHFAHQNPELFYTRLKAQLENQL